MKNEEWKENIIKISNRGKNFLFSKLESNSFAIRNKETKCPHWEKGGQKRDKIFTCINGVTHYPRPSSRLPRSFRKQKECSSRKPEKCGAFWKIKFCNSLATDYQQPGRMDSRGWMQIFTRIVWNLKIRNQVCQIFDVRVITTRW